MKIAIALIILLAILAIWLAKRMLAYKISAMAVLHYYLERGYEVPSKEALQKEAKEAMKHLF